MPVYSLQTLMKDEGVIDLVHMDIQNAEGDVIPSAAAAMTKQVRRVHIATHSARVEDVISEAMTREGWVCSALWPAHRQNDTPYGQISFEDGVSSWVNPTFG